MEIRPYAALARHDRVTITTVGGVTTVEPDYAFTGALSAALADWGMPITATAIMRAMDKIGRYDLTWCGGTVTVRAEFLGDYEAEAAMLPDACAWLFVHWANGEGRSPHTMLTGGA